MTISLEFLEENKISVVADFFEGGDGESDIGCWVAFTSEEKSDVYTADHLIDAVYKLCVAKGIKND